MALQPATKAHRLKRRTKHPQIDTRFSTAGQLRTDQLKGRAGQGFVAVVCARPDNEEAGQPAFKEIAREVEMHGLKAVHIPVSGTPTPEQVARLGEVMDALTGPVLGYCRSGTRSANLYAMFKQQA